MLVKYKQLILTIRARNYAVLELFVCVNVSIDVRVWGVSAEKTYE